MSLWQAVAGNIARVTGEAFAPGRPASLGGGCVNSTLRLEDGHRSFFVKLNRASLLDMFEAETEGLEEIAATKVIRVPKPICLGTAEGRAYLVLEHVEMGPGRSGSAAAAGRALARMHRTTGGTFGWRRDNTIGATPQSNTRDRDWIAFWRDRRLSFQLKLAADNGYAGELQSRGRMLLERLPELLSHSPRPSLLHGDLWGGNCSYDGEGNPVIYDPAVYFGDREADLAMTELFGGFPAAFYAAYDEEWPRDPGYRQRKTLYNLYHVLNHLNLFGGGYLGQARTMIDRLLAELG